MTDSNPYDGDYKWPTSLFDELYDQGKLAKLAYTMGYIFDASREAKKQGVEFYGINVDSDSDDRKQFTHAVADAELFRSFTPGEIKEVMEKNADFMNQAQSAEEGATGIIRSSMDPKATSGNFYGPSTGWSGYPDPLEPEALLSDEELYLIHICRCRRIERGRSRWTPPHQKKKTPTHILLAVSLHSLLSIYRPPASTAHLHH